MMGKTANFLTCRRVLAGVFTAALVLYGLGGTLTARAETLETIAPIGLLIEPTSGTTLFAKSADTPFQPGSIAKVLTAATVFKALADGELADDTLCKVSEHAWRTGGAPSGGATMFAAINSEIPVLDLLKGLLVHNANDAAIILAECLDGSEAGFAARMNALAGEIAMTQSRFVTPTGFKADTARTTARDLGALASYILKTHMDRYSLFALPEFTWNGIFQRNKNPLIGEIRQLDGLGAGSGEPDSYAGLASVNRDGRRVVAVVAGLNSDKARLKAMREVVEGAWDYYEIQTLYAKGAEVATARVFGGTASEVPLVASRTVDVLLPRGGTLDYRLRVVYSGPLKAPVKPGVTVGELRVLGEDGVVYQAPLETGGAVAAGPMETRALDGLTELLFGWF